MDRVSEDYGVCAAETRKNGVVRDDRRVTLFGDGGNLARDTRIAHEAIEPIKMVDCEVHKLAHVPSVRYVADQHLSSCSQCPADSRTVSTACSKGYFTGQTSRFIGKSLALRNIAKFGVNCTSKPNVHNCFQH
jgi:hypothetical protein